ncbi:D-alanyl-D-alanine carboxypeptidase, partial [Actinotignum timonense]|nr:D-alanyl-D-alanine carboxypeptidase [Actinotignum timonense]
ASNDIQKATETARKIVTEYGMTTAVRKASSAARTSNNETSWWESVRMEKVSSAPERVRSTPLRDTTSASVRELVDRMLTESDNTLAETLGHLVARERGESADFAGAARATHAALEELGYPLEGVVISDNSGLSETNRLTCVLQLAILEDAVNLADGTGVGCGYGAAASALGPRVSNPGVRSKASANAYPPARRSTRDKAI